MSDRLLDAEQARDWIAVVRRRRGWTVAELAERAGLSSNYVAKCLREPGSPIPPQLATAAGLRRGDYYALEAELEGELGGGSFLDAP